MQLKIPCRDANHYCDKNQYKEASFWEKIRLSFHLVYCRACRKYSLRNNKLSKAINNKEVHSISLSEKEHLQKRLQDQINSQ